MFLTRDVPLKSLRPSDAYMRHQRRPSLVQIMARRLIGAKPLSEPMLYHSQSGPYEQSSFNSNFKHFHSRKYIWKCRLANVGHFVSTSLCLAAAAASKHCLPWGHLQAHGYSSFRQGWCLNINISSYRYRNSHYKDETISWPSYDYKENAKTHLAWHGVGLIWH